MSDLLRILRRLQIEDRFNLDLKDWKSRLCPYTDSELERFCYQRTDELSNELKQEYMKFLQNFQNLGEEDGKIIKDWLFTNLVKPVWEKGTGIRPDWTWKNFLSVDQDLTKKKKYLDVGPCHGIHSNILYKEKFKGEFEFYAADILPAYLQLQTIFGIHANYFDASKMSLGQLYEERFFDIVIFAEVLEHLEQEEGERVLTDMCKLTQRSGKILVSFPVDARPFNGEPFGHKYQPDVNRISKILSNSNFSKIQHTKLWSGRTYQHVLIAKTG